MYFSLNFSVTKTIKKPVASKRKSGLSLDKELFGEDTEDEQEHKR